MRACALQAPELEEGSWRVKHHSQPDPEAPALSAEQQLDLSPPPQADAAPVHTPPDVASEQQPNLVPAAQDAAPAEQQPNLVSAAQDAAPAEQQPDIDPAGKSAAAQQQQPNLPPETQGVASNQMFAALANVGNLADIYPDSQVEPARQVQAHVPPPPLPEEAPLQDRGPEQPQVSSHTPLPKIAALSQGVYTVRGYCITSVSTPCDVAVRCISLRCLWRSLLRDNDTDALHQEVW